MSTSYKHYDQMTRAELIALLETQQSTTPMLASEHTLQSLTDTVQGRSTKLMMMVAFAVGAWIIMFAYIIAGATPINLTILLGTPLFSLLAFLYWRHWEPAAYFTVLLFVVMVSLLMPDPYVTEQVSMGIFLGPVLALVLLTPRWMVIAAATTLLIILARANWQGAYANPIFLAIFVNLIGGLLICRRVLDLKNEQLRVLNHTLEQRIVARTSELQDTLQELRRSSSELAQANQELARAARLKDEFLANMSHELRTPLTSILGRSELLLEDFADSLTELQRRSVHSIEESGRHLLELINDILDLSKIEAGMLTLDVQPIRIAGLCQSCIRMVAQTALKKRLAVRTVIDESVVIINADPRRLKQILVNLLANAVKFTPEGGEIGLEVRGNRDAHLVDLIVWDTGIGIAAIDQERLFQPFIQIDSSLARQYEGTGLGLALVSQLAALHSGYVRLTSMPGSGSRFTVTLPWEATLPSDAATS